MQDNWDTEEIFDGENVNHFFDSWDSVAWWEPIDLLHENNMIMMIMYSMIKAMIELIYNKVFYHQLTVHCDLHETKDEVYTNIRGKKLLHLGR